MGRRGTTLAKRKCTLHFELPWMSLVRGAHAIDVGSASSAFVCCTRPLGGNRHMGSCIPNATSPCRVGKDRRGQGRCLDIADPCCVHDCMHKAARLYRHHQAWLCGRSENSQRVGQLRAKPERHDRGSSLVVPAGRRWPLLRCQRRASWPLLSCAWCSK